MAYVKKKSELYFQKQYIVAEMNLPLRQLCCILLGKMHSWATCGADL